MYQTVQIQRIQPKNVLKQQKIQHINGSSCFKLNKYKNVKEGRKSCFVVKGELLEGSKLTTREVTRVQAVMEVPPQTLQKEEEDLGVNYRAQIVDVLNQWKRRLFTRMDDYRLHAVPSVIFVLYVTFEVVRVMSIPVLQREQFAGVEFSQILPFLLFINFMKDASGARLAAKHHKGLGKFFLVQSGLASVMTTAAMYYYSPDFPVSLDGAFRVASGVALPSLLFALVVYIKEAVQIAELRKDKKLIFETAVDRMKGVGFYVVPLVVPVWLAVNTSLMTAVGGQDLKQFLFQNYPQTSSALFSLGIISVALGSLGPAAGTLRVRKLISAGVEQSICVGLLSFFGIVLAHILESSDAALGVFVNPMATLHFIQSII
eukprot:TRINITY_DN297_c0_g1_i1.p2 TRINITY_DN297_c0_g1~~TRINITY_DN297_c0_g1_i1.p2  ORF type:complete len:386 (-),score=56.84 TRINITY_DN297_c0_g1_i1:3285-4406(-)